MDLVRNFAQTAKAIHAEVTADVGPPEEGLRAGSQRVVLASLVRGTRGYIERIVNQANGTYENGWYDACAVMLRRLLETLLIEAFEHHKVAKHIQNSSGDFFYLRDMITQALKEPAWNLSRNCKNAMPRLKDVGDKSAHSRRFVAQRGDIDKLLPDIRVAVQELVYLAGLK
jgi:hypothetical protein